MTKSNEQKTTDIQKMEEQYKSLLPSIDRFSGELVNQVNTLVESEGVALGFPIQHRVKKWASLEEKFRRINRQFKSIKDVQDLVGVRILLLFQRDVAKVSALIENTLELVRKYDPSEKLGSDQFGYSSIHLVVKLPEKWLAVPTMKGLEDFKAEVQIRTLAQHFWAETSHRLQYKQEESIPPAVQRAISRVSALLETVDLEFERVLQERDNYRTSIDVSGTDEQLNVDLLERTLDSILPKENRAEPEPYGELLKELNHLNIKTQQELKTLINRHLEEVLEKDAKTAESMLAHYQNENMSSREIPGRLLKKAFASHCNLVREVLIAEFGKEYFAYLRKNVNQPASSKTV